MTYREQQSWQLEKAWADGHRAAIEEVVRSVAGRIINIQVSSFQEDTEEAIDYDIKVESGAMACRIRRADRVSFRDLTITSYRPSGAPPETDKILKGRVRWYLYAWAHQGGFVEWMFVDLHVVRQRQLINEALNKKREVVVEDGSKFIHISFDTLDRAGALVASKRVPPDELGVKVEENVDATAECRHGLKPEWCETCRDAAKYGGQVFVSLGGSTFHRRPDCSSLEKGQLRVEQSNRHVSPIESLGPARAFAMGRRPCLTCFGEGPHS